MTKGGVGSHPGWFVILRPQPKDLSCVGLSHACGRSFTAGRPLGGGRQDKRQAARPDSLWSQRAQDDSQIPKFLTPKGLGIRNPDGV